MVAAVRFSTIVTFCQLLKVFCMNFDWFCHFLSLSTLTNVHNLYPLILQTSDWQLSKKNCYIFVSTLINCLFAPGKNILFKGFILRGNQTLSNLNFVIMFIMVLPQKLNNFKLFLHESFWIANKAVFLK